MTIKIKVIIARILTSYLVNLILKKITFSKIKKDDLFFDLSLLPINNNSFASLFWGFYESSEIRFVKKYIGYDLDVIECGSSIGIVSSYIGNKIKDKRLFCVEANEDLIPILDNNLYKNSIKNYFIYNAFIGKSSKGLVFKKSNNNISGKLVNSDDKFAVSDKSLSLSTIVNDNNIKDFNLVCDIEGAEYFILEESVEIFSKLNLCIIELHENNQLNNSFTINNFISSFLAKGFKIIDSQYPVFVFKNVSK
jgi:FkbM family methyltransferase